MYFIGDEFIARYGTKWGLGGFGGELGGFLGGVVTWSDGGAIGGFHTRVFHVADDRVNEADSVKTAFAGFRGRHWCKARGDNVQAYAWDEKTGALVLVMSIYPNGDCGEDLGHTEAYLVQPANGAIIRQLNFRDFNAYAKYHPQ